MQSRLYCAWLGTVAALIGTALGVAAQTPSTGAILGIALDPSGYPVSPPVFTLIVPASP